MNPAEVLRSRRDEILRICDKYGAKNVRVFGSVARGEADENSDIDLLVELEPDRSLFDLGGLWHDLNETLGVKVEVFTVKSLRDAVRERALREAVPL
ncbi:nucleotidyltransferase family protein [Calditerricola satsumensis]|uniref:Nucleotidyltransferase n=1 Tax=Calditerricola satsumensis TaxID=373054 RepID=A0A8J3B9X9_9BACI|nr:nucleotidyltransferase family protein [Calditerricola satsumensis]GGJ95997.1 nucleotidyltransferase [Calditerricola satsumensis]